MYDTAQPEQLYNILTATTPTLTNGTADLWERAPNPADYSLEDIEEVLRKVRKWHRRTGTPVPELLQENTKALRRTVRARDATVSTQTTTKPI
jgi:hypothetical protein